MTSSRYPENNRYPRERSPYRDRRPSTYTGGYPPRGNDTHNRPNVDSPNFPPRDVPRGPKSLVDPPPRGLPSGPASGPPPGPRDGRGRGFGRGDGPPSALRDAPPLSSSAHPPRDHAMRDQWRASDRERDFRDRRVSPPRRSPTVREPRDFPPVNIERARRNSRDGPPSAGSTYSDPPLVSGSSYRGSGIGRGRGGRDFGGDFRPRGRGYHNDDRDRHHDPRDARDRMYRPRSRSRDPLRRDIRDEREFDRRERDDRRFERRDEEPRRYDSYQGSASANLRPALRNLDTHRGNPAIESRNPPGASAGPSTPHSAHHPGPGDRAGPSADHFSRRTSVATEPQNANARRDDLIASRVESSRERYAPRPSSPPASVPAFGVYNPFPVSTHNNVWRNPALDTKPASTAQVQRPVAPTPPVSGPTPVAAAPIPVAAPKPAIPAGLSTVPPTGPKADRVLERPLADVPAQEHKPPLHETSRIEAAPRPTVGVGPSTKPQGQEGTEARVTNVPPPVNSQPALPGPRNRSLPTSSQIALRPNGSPSFSRAPLPTYPARDASPGAIPMGPRNGLHSTSPKTTPLNIPTGPKADRTNSLSRPPVYGPPERPPFPSPRNPHAKSNQWINPRYNRTSTIPSKREFPVDDRDRALGGTAAKNPRLDNSYSAPEVPQPEQPKAEPSMTPEDKTFPPKPDVLRDQAPKVESPKPTPVDTRRFSDISMPDISPRTERPPVLPVATVPAAMEDSDEDFDLDEDDFAESEAKYNREKALLESRLVDLSAAHLRATTPLQEIILLCNITPAYLPQETPKIVEEEPASPPHVEPPAASTTTDLPTPPRFEDAMDEDVAMSDKHEVSIAPATRALELRQRSLEREPSPEELSSLPYLVSGPPTPLSDPDHDQPSVPASVLLTIRDNLCREAAPEKTPEDVLKEYAAAYKRWRYFVEDLDHDRDHDPNDKQASVEPTLKATTPDIASSSASALLEAPPPTTGRRAHSGRFATEYDLERVIRESVKTAEQERSVKEDKEYEKILWDPEREATVPSTITSYEAKRRRFVNTNFQREPGQGIFVYHYEPPEDDFTQKEHEVMVYHYRDQYAKKWGKLAEILYAETGIPRTYKHTINHYYATKWNREFKQKQRRGGARKKARTTKARAVATVDRFDPHADDTQAPPALTDSGRPRRQAAPTFGADAENDPTGAASTPGRQRRQTDVDGVQEKVARRTKAPRGRAAGKSKAQPLAAAPVASPAKVDRKEKGFGVKTEEDPGKRPAELPMLSHPPGLLEEQPGLQNDPATLPPFATGIVERPRANTQSRTGPSSYWSVTEQNDFQKNVAHFGTDWGAIASHMGTKTVTMVKNQYLRLTEGGGADVALAKAAEEADKRRERGEDLGPPPTPTPVSTKRRYESGHVALPRALAPTPDGNELLRSPSAQPAMPPKFSPPQPAPGRFSTIAQAPSQVPPMISTGGSGSISETSLAALPSIASHQSPPPPLVQSQVPQSAPQHKSHHTARPGYPSDEQLRMENRPMSGSTLGHPSRVFQQQIQPHVRPQEPAQPPMFRGPVHNEREAHSRMEQQQQHEQELQSRYQHSRQVSRDIPFGRQFTPNPSMSAQPIPPMRPSDARSPEDRPHALQGSRYMPPHAQPTTQPPPEIISQTPGSMAVPPHLGSRGTLGTQSIKEEQRHYPQPHPPHTQAPPQPPNQPLMYTQPLPTSQPQAPPPAPKPAPAQKKSNLLDLLNAEPEEPKRKRPMDAPSHTPTPQQQTPVAPPPPSNPASARREFYGDAGAQSAYNRTLYSQQTPQPQVSSVRQPVQVDLTGEPPVGRAPSRAENWQQQRSAYHPGHGQMSIDSPHATHVQPPFADPRVQPSHRDHRAVFAQHNGPRHNPSPPPAAFNNSPHMHSRTASLSTPAQQARQGMGGPPAVQNTQQQGSGASQVLQPNPYNQADPPGGTPHPSAHVGIRGSPHHANVAQQRELQARNDQSQGHNGSMPFPNAPRGEVHHTQQHSRGPSVHDSRGPSVHDQFRGRDPREFEAQHHDRDLSRERSQRPEVLRDPYIAGAPQQSHQDFRYQHPPQPPQPDRGYVTQQRSHTPLSRPEHHQNSPHPAQQHSQPHPLRSEGVRQPFAQRQQEEPIHRYRESYAMDERYHREEQHQQAMMRDGHLREREMREREARDRQMQENRYREDMMRRDSRASGPPPPQQSQPPQQPQHHGQHEQRPPHGGSMEWAPTGPRQQQDRWQTRQEMLLRETQQQQHQPRG